MSKKNKKAEIIKNEQQIQGVIPALLAVDAAMGVEALQASDLLKLKRKTAKEKVQDEQEQGQLNAEGSEASEEEVLADLIQLVDSDISLTQSKDNCKINSKGEEECDEGAVWWKALLGLGLLGAAVSGGGGGGAPAPAVVGSNTFRHTDFNQRDDQDDYLNIRTTNFNEVNLVLTGSEHIEEGTDFLNTLIDDDAFPYEGDRQLAVDFAGSSNIAVFNTSITDDKVALRFNYSGLDGGASNTSLHTVTMTVDNSKVELEGGHFIEEDGLTFILTVSNHSELVNYESLISVASEDIGDFTTDQSFDILSFESSDILTYSLLSLESTDYWLAEDGSIYSSSDLSEEFEVGYINTQNDIIINGDNVGEIHDGQIYLNRINGYDGSLSTDLVNISGDDAHVVIRAIDSSNINNIGGNLVDVQGDDATIDFEASGDSDVYSTSHLIDVDGEGVDITLEMSNSYVKSRNGDIVTVAGEDASVDIDLVNSTIDTDEKLVDIVGDSADIHFSASVGSYLDNDYGDLIEVSGDGALLDINVSGGSTVVADSNLILIHGSNASIDIDVTSGSVVYGEDHIVRIYGQSADVDILVSGDGSNLYSYRPGFEIAHIDGDTARVNIEVIDGASVDAIDEIVDILGNSADVDILVSGDDSLVESYWSDVVYIDGTNASVDIDVLDSADLYADYNIIAIEGDSADVRLNVAGSGSLASADYDDVINIVGVNASVDIDVTSGAYVFGEDSIADITGSNAIVSLNVSTGSSVETYHEDAIYVFGANASVDIDVTGGSSVDAADSLVDIVGNSADVYLTVSGNSYVENDEFDMIYLAGNNASAEIYISGSSDVFADDNFLNIQGSNADVILDVTGLGTNLEAESNDVININGVSASVDMDVTQSARVVAQDSIVDIDGVDATVRMNVATGSSVDTQSDDAINVLGANAWVDVDVTGGSSVDAADSLVDIVGNSADVYLTVSGNSYVENDEFDMIFIEGTSVGIVSASVDIQVLSSSDVYANDSLVEIRYGTDSADDSYVSLSVSGDSLVSNDSEHLINLYGDRAVVNVKVNDSGDVDARDSLIYIDANHVNQNTDFIHINVNVSDFGSINNIDPTEGSVDIDTDYALVSANSINTTIDFLVSGDATVLSDAELIQISSDSDSPRNGRTVDNALVNLTISDDATVSADGSFVEIYRGSNANVSFILDDSTASYGGGGDGLISIDGNSSDVSVEIVNGSTLTASDDIVNIDGGIYASVDLNIESSYVYIDEDMVEIDGNSADVSIDIFSSEVLVGDAIVEIDDGHDADIILNVSGDSELSYEGVGISVDVGDRADIHVDLDDSAIHGEDTFIYVDGNFASIDLHLTNGASIDLDYYSYNFDSEVDAYYFNENNLIEVDGNDALVNFSMINDGSRTFEQGDKDLNVNIAGDVANLVDITGDRARVSIALTSDVNDEDGDGTLDIYTTGGDLVYIKGYDASVDITMISADLYLENDETQGARIGNGDVVFVDGDSAEVNIIARNPLNEPDENNDIDAENVIDVRGSDAVINADFENLDDVDLQGHFISVDGDNADINLSLNFDGSNNDSGYDSWNVDGSLVYVEGLSASVDLVIENQLAEGSRGLDVRDGLLSLNRGNDSNVNLDVSDVEFEIGSSSDFIYVNGASIDLNVELNAVNISVDAINDSFGHLLHAIGDDLTLTFSADDLVVGANSDGWGEGLGGGFHLDGSSADVAITLENSSLDFVRYDFIRVIDGDNLELSFEGDELNLTARNGFNIAGDFASVDISLFDSSNVDIDNVLLDMSGSDVNLKFELTDSNLFAADGLQLTGVPVGGHSIDIDINNSMIGTSGDFVRITNGQNTYLDIEGTDLFASMDSLVDISRAAGADVNIDLNGISTLSSFGDNMVTLRGVDAYTNVSVNLENYGDGTVGSYIANYSIDNIFASSGDILNIQGNGSTVTLSIAGLEAQQFTQSFDVADYVDYFTFISPSGVVGHGDMVDLSGSNHSLDVTVSNSVLTINNWAELNGIPPWLLFDYLDEFAAISSTTGILELDGGQSNDVVITVDDSQFYSLTSTLNNNALIYSVGVDNDITVNMNTVFMGSIYSEDYMDYDRVNLAYLEGDDSDFTVNTVNSEYNSRIELQASQGSITHVDDAVSGEFNSMHLYVNGNDNQINVNTDGAFTPGQYLGYEGLAYGGVVVGNDNSLTFSVDSQHLALSTYSYSEDYDAAEVGYWGMAGLLISSDSGSSTDITFDLTGGSHLDGVLDLTGKSGDADVEYYLDIKADARSTVDLDIFAFGEDVVVNLELDNLDNADLYTGLFANSGKYSLINLDTSDYATVNISMQENGDSNFYINHTGWSGDVNLVQEPTPHDNDNFDRILVDQNHDMYYSGFNGATDDLEIANAFTSTVDTYNYVAIDWNSSVDYNLGTYSNDLDDYRPGEIVNTTRSLLEKFGTYHENGENTDTATRDDNLANDLVIYHNGSFSDVENAVWGAAQSGFDFDDWFQDIYLVHGQSDDIDIYTWDGNSFELNAHLDGAYMEFFDLVGNVYNSNLVTSAYDHAYTYGPM